jgi:uncharacterized protein YhaN
MSCDKCPHCSFGTKKVKLKIRKTSIPVFRLRTLETEDYRDVDMDLDLHRKIEVAKLHLRNYLDAVDRVMELLDEKDSS